VGILDDPPTLGHVIHLVQSGQTLKTASHNRKALPTCPSRKHPATQIGPNTHFVSALSSKGGTAGEEVSRRIRSILLCFYFSSLPLPN
jgi:hypothetical protein